MTFQAVHEDDSLTSPFFAAAEAMLQPASQRGQKRHREASQLASHPSCKPETALHMMVMHGGRPSTAPKHVPCHCMCPHLYDASVQVRCDGERASDKARIAELEEKLVRSEV